MEGEGRKERRSCTILQEKGLDTGVVADAGCALCFIHHRLKNENSSHQHTAGTQTDTQQHNASSNTPL